MQSAVLQEPVAAPPTAPRLVAADVYESIAVAARAYIKAAKELDDEYRRRLGKVPEALARTAGRLRVDWSARYPELVDLADETVRVMRAPGEPRVSVRIGALSGFTITAYTGGRGHRLARPMLAARVSCDDLPEVPWHSCKHGPPPHRILVLIPGVHNDQAIYYRLGRAAEHANGGLRRRDAA